MTYKAEVLLATERFDGMSRLVTFCVTFPRFILAEVNTHTIISKNSASSRAIPTEKIMEQVRTNPFVPATFNSRVAGMGIGEPLADQSGAREEWLHARDNALESAQRLMELGNDKSRVNRLLEPFMWHTAILSGTNWRNFFGLRCPDGDPTAEFPAQIEFQTLASKMRHAYIDAPVQTLEVGEWHTPYAQDLDLPPLDRALVSAGICGRVSYNRHDNEESAESSIERAKQFVANKHWSPLQHQGKVRDLARAEGYYSGNFYGYAQLRKMYTEEDDALSARDVWWGVFIK